MKYLAWIAVVVAGVSAWSPRAGVDDTLKALQEFARQERLGAATPTDQEAAEARITAKAKEAVTGVDPAKVEAKEGFQWAEIFEMAKMRVEAKAAVDRYLASGDTTNRLPAQFLLARLYLSDKQPEKALNILQSVRQASTADDSKVIVSQTIGILGPLAKFAGVDAALKDIDEAEVLARFDTGKPGGEAQNQANIVAFSQARAGLLEDAARHNDALSAIDAGLARLQPTSNGSIRLKSFRNQLTIIGQAAPRITVEQEYGSFHGLSEWKGKVVLVVFFAHWHTASLSPFPDLVKLYVDLHPKGLEVLGYTTFYGYFGTDKGLTHDQEFAKMDGLVKRFGLPWPVALGDRSVFQDYGVTEIPYFAVIDKAGNVRDLHLGYDPSRLADLRDQLEVLLAE